MQDRKGKMELLVQQLYEKNTSIFNLLIKKCEMNGVGNDNSYDNKNDNDIISLL